MAVFGIGGGGTTTLTVPVNLCCRRQGSLPKSRTYSTSRNDEGNQVVAQNVVGGAASNEEANRHERTLLRQIPELFRTRAPRVPRRGAQKLSRGVFPVSWAHDKILRCRINAAFRTLLERRIYAAGRRPQKKSVVRPSLILPPSASREFYQWFYRGPSCTPRRRNTWRRVCPRRRKASLRRRGLC